MNALLSIALFGVASIATAGAQSTSITVSDAWSRPAIGMGVVYAKLNNAAGSPDRLIGATSPLATSVTLHRSVESKMPGMNMHGSSMGNMPMGDSMMSMKAEPYIAVPAHGSTTLAPGGYHLMLALKHDLKTGETIPLRLHFQHAGWIATHADVRSM